MAIAGSTKPLCLSIKVPYLRPSSWSSSSSQLPIPNTRNVVKCVNSVSVYAKIGSSSSSSSSSSKGGRGGSGVLERPAFDQSQFDLPTQLQEGGDIGQVRDKRGAGSGDSYRVLLIDDIRHTEKLVAKVLPQAVPFVTLDDARRLFAESREKGVAVVIVTVKEHAEFYAQMMIRGGLRSKIEPESNTA